MYKNLKLISGSVHRELAKSISEKMNIPLTPIRLKKFRDGEIYIKIEESMRGEDVFIIQPTCTPVNDSLMELLIIIDAVRRASAGRINAVIPYFGYARQDRKASSREPITSKLIANILTTAGVNRVVTVDLHADQIQGFFDIPMDHFQGYIMFYDYFKNKNIKNLVAVSPDAGAVKKTRRFAKALNIPLVIIDKRRPEHNEAEILNVIGDVKGKNAIIIDDIIDTGGTIVNAASVLKLKGAKEVYICATHGVLSDGAAEKLKKSVAKEIILTDTIPIPEKKRFRKLKIISIAPLMAEIINRIHHNESLGQLFDLDGCVI
ncbi:ribose-phosphate pyrophosphokinase [Candidatus Woesearchaeota archaeon]|nr:ribose-phosphate pyrophosphokinase [Candidatus Woesearchaeota archaeon]